MNDLNVFENPAFGQVRTTIIENEPWFVGKDIAEALGYKNPQKSIRDHVDEEDRGVNKMDTPSGNQELLIINESGLYSLILSSKMPKAKEFKRWVTSEVLPSIRKTGSYAAKPETVAPTIAQRLEAAAILTKAPEYSMETVRRILEPEFPELSTHDAAVDPANVPVMKSPCPTHYKPIDRALIENRMNQMGMTISRLSQLACLPERSIVGYLVGTNVPNSHNRFKLCAVLGLSDNELIL